MLSKLKRPPIMKIHGYLSMFFLLPMLMYAVTGIAYIFGYNGAVERSQYPISVEAWPLSEQQAKAAVPEILAAVGMDATPAPHSLSRSGLHTWRGLDETIVLKTNTDGEPIAELSKSNFFRQMFMVHKSHAGTTFDIIGVAAGLYLVVMMLTGLILTIKTVILHKGAWASAGIGLVSMIACYVIAIT